MLWTMHHINPNKKKRCVNKITRQNISESLDLMVNNGVYEVKILPGSCSSNQVVSIFSSLFFEITLEVVMIDVAISVDAERSVVVCRSVDVEASFII